jgi:hypothetical protein
MSSGSAVFSSCGRYRYRLDRSWSVDGMHPRIATFVMLNPSTADAARDDPTIRRCIQFARREHCTGLVVVNLFGWRATDPRDLAAAADPVGPDNDEHVADALVGAAIAIAGWGRFGSGPREIAVAAIAARLGVRMRALGTTSTGAPRHPLYLSRDARLSRWSRDCTPSR